MDDVYLRPEDVKRILKVSDRTLLYWCEEGKVSFVKTKGGHRRYLRDDIIKLCRSTNDSKQNTKFSYCYCRVSTREQKEDLERQISFFTSKYPDHIIISDYGSGLNFKRKGLKTIISEAIKGNIKEVVVTHKDRLCRFGFELIESIINEYSDGKIMVLDKGETSPEKELVNDLISIITVFSSRLYGLRSHSIKKQIKEQTGNKIKNYENQTISK